MSKRYVNCLHKTPCRPTDNFNHIIINYNTARGNFFYSLSLQIYYAVRTNNIIIQYFDLLLLKQEIVIAFRAHSCFNIII